MTQDTATYREALELLCDDAEGTYFFYRFTDPTFVTAEALLQAVGQPVGQRPTEHQQARLVHAPPPEVVVVDRFGHGAPPWGC